MDVEKILRLKDVSAWEDVFSYLKYLELEGSTQITHRGREIINYDQANFEKAHSLVKDVRARAAESVKTGGGERALLLYKRCLLFDAPFEFDSAIRYAEFDREPAKKFYEPRRDVLLRIVNALEDLEYRRIKRLFVCLPPGTGKSTLAIMFMVWSAYRRPDQQIFGSSHNMEFLKGVHGEILRMLDPDGEYLWHEIFPKVEIVGQSAKNLRIDLGTPKRFETLEFSPIGAGSAGKVRATNLLYSDDLVSGIEEAMSLPLMDKLWNKYITDLRSRIIGDDCVELMIQTPWSIHDPIDRLMTQYESDKDTKIIKIPAFDRHERTQFFYPYGLGYSTKQLKDIRASMDDATWRALYMMSPIEREGVLYSPDELKRYLDLPETEPDAILAVCDSKEQGSDYLCMPIAYKYGNQFYIEQIICDNSSVEVLETRVAEAVIDHKITNLCIESNRGGTIFARNVEEKIKSKGGRCSIVTKWNQQNKETRIITRAGIVKANFIFKDESKYTKEYQRAMKFLTGYTQTGKNKHDDVPDAMSMLVDFIDQAGVQRVKVARRLF